MSYNITTFTIKELDGFTLKLSDVFDRYKLDDTEADKIIPTDDALFTVGDFPGVEILEMTGHAQEDYMYITDIEYHGEFSGNYFDTFLDLLKTGHGKLRALVVWEGGDSVEMLTVEQGVVTRKAID